MINEADASFAQINAGAWKIAISEISAKESQARAIKRLGNARQAEILDTLATLHARLAQLSKESPAFADVICDENAGVRSFTRKRVETPLEVGASCTGLPKLLGLHAIEDRLRNIRRTVLMPKIMALAIDG